MKDLLAARRYAQAFFNIVVAHGKDEDIEEELVAFATSLKSSRDLQKFFDSPKFSFIEKRKFLLRIYQGRQHEVYVLLVDFFSILLEKNRFNLVYEIALEFKKIADDFQGQGTAEIRTAVPLREESEKAIVTRLEKIAGYKIKVNKIVDPGLLGGVMVRVRNKIIDGSVRHEIERIKKEITRKTAV